MWTFIAIAVCFSFVAAAFAVTIVWAMAGRRFYLKFRGKRLVICPETHRAAAVEVDAKGLAKEIALHGATLPRNDLVQTRQGLCLSECSRWPGRQDCPQRCLHQIEAALEPWQPWQEGRHISATPAEEARSLRVPLTGWVTVFLIRQPAAAGDGGRITFSGDPHHRLRESVDGEWGPGGPLC